MIPRDYITSWRAKVPWVQDFQVEQDLVISRALVEIYSKRDLSAALAFRVFLFQVPYVCLFVIAAGFVADLTGRDVESFFHGNGITHLTAQSVSGAAHFSGWTRATAFVLALYALFLTARSMVKVLTIVHALVWDVPRAKLASTTRAALCSRYTA